LTLPTVQKETEWEKLGGRMMYQPPDVQPSPMVSATVTLESGISMVY
jgi:hypothetical protein